MNLLPERIRGEDRAVSPVIGVILMVAITVILAAVIASFVLGLGDSAAEPSPSPTIDSSAEADALNFSVTGGDDFSAGDASIQAEITVENSSLDGADTGTITFDTAIDSSDTQSSEGIEINDTDPAGNDVEISADYTPVDSGEEVTAGDDFSFGLVGDGSDQVEITEWEVQIIWNPADQDSDTIYSDSSS